MGALSDLGRAYLSARSYLTGAPDTPLSASLTETVMVEQTNVLRSGEVRSDGYYDNP
ncbi:hypothetical protein SEA_ALSABER_5 [Streptomyces phage Alsaber]|uniref:Uncharacterized protein n=1 Tax=Streptomyces phage Alsaber TaxID=2053672 RepID=A0A2H4PGF6_9CAUD|nr:hypothetical protein KGG97_gp05 [Streptomyces phage Alsaber]ATW61280.1 hypothetical protein SEA_ALSABER_5 [Streptomyces phage Alsaber]